MSANERQVDGDHYAGKFQHWDFVRLVGLDYMEAQVARYVGRHHKKHGEIDLHKADHFLQKMEERRAQMVGDIIPAFCAANGLGATEQLILVKLITGHLGEARAGIAALLTTDYGESSRGYVNQD